MDARRVYSVWGIPLTALTSLIVGIAALGIVVFLLILFSNELRPVTLAAGAPVMLQNLLQTIVTWLGIGFLLALAGLIAGFCAIPERGADDRSQACKWICGAGISLSVAAIFADMLLILYLRALAFVMWLD